MPISHLILKRASGSRPSGQWNEDDFDVLVTPYGATTLAKSDGSRQPSANELDGARYQGKHVRRLREAGRQLLTARAADVQRLFDETKEAFGTIDVLVNNAGV